MNLTTEEQAAFDKIERDFRSRADGFVLGVTNESASIASIEPDGCLRIRTWWRNSLGHFSVTARDDGDTYLSPREYETLLGVLVVGKHLDAALDETSFEYVDDPNEVWVWVASITHRDVKYSGVGDTREVAFEEMFRNIGRCI